MRYSIKRYYQHVVNPLIAYLLDEIFPDGLLMKNGNRILLSSYIDFFTNNVLIVLNNLNDS